ncbi:MAG: hypothetical protein D6741_03115, partial [Planctomycetota bacterium]
MWSLPKRFEPTWIEISSEEDSGMTTGTIEQRRERRQVIDSRRAEWMFGAVIGMGLLLGTST